MPELLFEQLKTFGGHLECRRCGRIEPLGDPAARVLGEGWPKCCGSTMTWLTARELADKAEVLEGFRQPSRKGIGP